MANISVPFGPTTIAITPQTQQIRVTPPDEEEVSVTQTTQQISVIQESSTIEVYNPAGPRGAQGPVGPPGAGLVITGTVPSKVNLPTTGNTYGDLWIAQDTGHGWVWEAPAPGAWSDVGPIQGAPGPSGPAPQCQVMSGFGSMPPGASGTFVLASDPYFLGIGGWAYFNDSFGSYKGSFRVTGVDRVAFTVSFDSWTPAP